MNTIEREAFFFGAAWCQRVSALLLAFALLFAVESLDLRAAQNQPAPAQAPKGPAYETQSPEQLQQLFA